MTDKKVACLGLGGMGGGIAGRLTDLGWKPVLWNRSIEKAQTIAEGSGGVAITPAEAVTGVDVAMLSLADEPSVESVLFGENGVVSALRKGAMVVDMSTVSPEYSRQVTGRLNELGFRRVEANLVGNPMQARAGAARVLAGGATEDIDEVRELLTVIGRQLVELGAIGVAATLKLALNALLGSQVVALAEVVNYGVEAGLDRDLLLRTIAESAFSSPVMSHRANLMREEKYVPAGFRSVLMEKDLRLTVADAAIQGVQLPVIATAARRYERMVAAGKGELDAAAILDQQFADAGDETKSQVSAS
ncbi:NAD(P)-dependent oxidoreductase [Alloactinosynnema sp. L-07]|uniref:NAD(P)-dependent oxidoreductase n=1 Tax=Alloactinosynnema sp. L-07 TaxID=1653480 RepID=UPI0006B52511|nr:NAD(P)-dependent oxidoreductase [Alloactinosynnema sp. L-07]